MAENTSKAPNIKVPLTLGGGRLTFEVFTLAHHAVVNFQSPHARARPWVHGGTWRFALGL